MCIVYNIVEYTCLGCDKPPYRLWRRMTLEKVWEMRLASERPHSCRCNWRILFNTINSHPEIYQDWCPRCRLVMLKGTYGLKYENARSTFSSATNDTAEATSTSTTAPSSLPEESDVYSLAAESGSDFPVLRSEKIHMPDDLDMETMFYAKKPDPQEWSEDDMQHYYTFLSREYDFLKHPITEEMQRQIRTHTRYLKAQDRSLQSLWDELHGCVDDSDEYWHLEDICDQVDAKLDMEGQREEPDLDLMDHLRELRATAKDRQEVLGNPNDEWSEPE